METAFKTLQALFEWFVMPLGLINTLSTFMVVMTQMVQTLFRHICGCVLR